MSESADDRLDQLLQQCEALDDDVAKLLRKCDAASPRAMLSLAMCNAAFEHAVSQRVLMEEGLTGTALALCRLRFEAVVRAAWIGQGASNKWVKAFTTAVEGEDHREPIMGPPIPSMLDAFEKYAPHVVAEFRKLYGTIEGMHSFVHGGSQTVAHALMGGYPADKLAGPAQSQSAAGLHRELRHRRGPERIPEAALPLVDGEARRCHAAGRVSAGRDVGFSRPPGLRT